MRPRLTTLCLLGLLAIAFGAWTHLDRRAVREGLIERTVRTQRKIQSEIRLRSALEGAKNSSQGWILEVKGGWFALGGPENPLLTASWRPWLETALPDEHAMRHPEIRIAREGVAAWWYNPAQGVVRARVPDQGTHRASVELYERVNRTP